MAMVAEMVAQIESITLTCADRSPQTGPYGGYTTWDLLMEAMARQRKKPPEERIRPCLKDKNYYDWWIVQVPWCQLCPDCIWNIAWDGREVKAKAISIKRPRIELAVEGTGEVLTYQIGKGFT